MTIRERFQLLLEGETKTWRSWDLNPGLSACEADTLPLSYTPAYTAKRLTNEQSAVIVSNY